MKTRLFTFLLLYFFSLVAVPAEEGVAWDSLSSEQQTLLNDVKDSWDQLPAQRQQRLHKGANRWGQMTNGQRNQAKLRMKRWKSMDADQRQKIRDRFQRYKDLTPGQQERIRNRQQRKQFNLSKSACWATHDSTSFIFFCGYWGLGIELVSVTFEIQNFIFKKNI